MISKFARQIEATVEATVKCVKELSCRDPATNGEFLLPRASGSIGKITAPDLHGSSFVTLLEILIEHD